MPRFCEVKWVYNIKPASNRVYPCAFLSRLGTNRQATLPMRPYYLTGLWEYKGIVRYREFQNQVFGPTVACPFCLLLDNLSPLCYFEN